MGLAGVDAGPGVGGGVIGVDGGCTAFVSRDAVEGWCGLKSLMEQGKGHGHSWQGGQLSRDGVCELSGMYLSFDLYLGWCSRDVRSEAGRCRLRHL